jgi:hypothetical protein
MRKNAQKRKRREEMKNCVVSPVGNALRVEFFDRGALHADWVYQSSEAHQMFTDILIWTTTGVLPK